MRYFTGSDATHGSGRRANKEPAGRIATAQRILLLPGAFRVTGQVTTSKPIRCIVITDESRRVVGVALLSSEQTTSEDRGGPPSMNIEGYAPLREGTYRVSVFFEDTGDPSVLDGVVRRKDGPFTVDHSRTWD